VLVSGFLVELLRKAGYRREGSAQASGIQAGFGLRHENAGETRENRGVANIPVNAVQ
jgi:hypothetical protein